MKYRCTKCHKEVEFDSPMAFCPYCGGKMEKVNDDAPEVSGAVAIILEELKSILESKKPTVDASDLKIKSSDEDSLPDFQKVQGYVLKAAKIDKLFFNLEESISNIRKYFESKSEFEKDIAPKGISKDVADLDKYLVDVAAKVGWTTSFDKFSLPSLHAHFNSGIATDIQSPSLRLLELTATLVKKCKGYVVTNNIFDDTCWNSFGVTVPKNVKDKLSDLATAIENTSKLIKKNYVYDFLGDSSNDVAEMMKCVWESLALIYACSTKDIDVVYSLDRAEIKDAKKFYNDLIKKHYADYDATVPTVLKKISTWDEVTLKATIKEIEKLKKPGTKVKVDKPTKKSGQETGDDKLNALIGLAPVKTTAQMIKAYVAKNKGKLVDLHMCFEGNPGTGKTEVARIIAQILYEAGALPTNKVVEVDRGKLVAGYIGQTALKTQQAINSAMGGVLFVDEAYELAHENDELDFGSEAVATLIKGMEDNKGKFCVILAGYKNEMEKMLATNPGFKSRIQFYVDFPNYSRDELKEITKMMLAKNEYACTEEALEGILDLTDYQRKETHFGNAREARRFVEQAIMAQSMRTISDENAERLIERVDVETIAKTNKIPLHKGGTDELAITPEEKLGEMIGLASVKKTVAKIRATIKKNPGSMNLHMCFYGNPGTGKTEVARIMSTLLYEAGALPEAKFVETDASGMIGKFTGSSGAKAQSKINEALGGVLFIDEAYALATTPGGEEAIATLLKEMEDKRGQFCVILAGYRKEMLQMLAVNPGFTSRIQFTLDFEDYSRDDLKQIALLMAKKKNYILTDDALEGIARITDIKRQYPDFANARDVRNVLDQVIMNTSVRTIDNDDDRTIILSDVTDYAKEAGFDIADHDANDINPKLKKHLYEGIHNLPSLFKGIENKKFEVDQKFLEQAVVSISDDQGQGTGFIISPDGFVLTCNHCISENEQKIRVAFFTEDGQRIFKYFNFIVICADKLNDVALLRIATDDYKFKFLPLSSKKSVDYTPTRDFFMTGYPFGGESFQELSITTGKIASVNEVGNGRVSVFADMFGKPGNSGSPTIDAETSKVIGVFWGGIGPKENIIPCFTPIEPVWELLKHALNILEVKDEDEFGE